MKTTLFIGLTLAVAGTANAQFFPERDPADLNRDGLIDGADLAIMLSKWGPASPPWAVVLEQCPDPDVIIDEKLRAAILATGLPWRVQDIGTGIEMLLVPPGTFMMGCSASVQSACFDNENPVHQVTLTKAFYLGRYEVTQAQWTNVMGSNPSGFQSPSGEVPADQVQNRPVERVSWNMIQEFNAATGLRLPTEAEWEHACRAGTTTAFNNGSDDDATLGSLAWFGASASGGNSSGQTHPVGQKLPNPLGFYDMHGNVWEWVNDRFSATYYSVSPAVDPPGPISGPDRVLRGGSWATFPQGCRSSQRDGYPPSNAPSRYGLRVARTP